MFGLSLGHILILLVVILLFGAKRLPELGGALGRGMRAFRKGIEGKEDSQQDKEQITKKDHHDPGSQS